ncbi:coiled-coil domain-containing protein 89-like [Babylonia areolata]|uniref:coiled-coil domain-containing protein 89-like n=1 Tax=Babylonia areolata TaxID=304850 RepID=UPI003FD29B94
MSSNHRTPRDLRQMVSDSHQDMQEMQDSLAKLRGLKEDDKTEAAMLRSRIDEQSKLIMILKQRADEEIIRAQTLDRVNKELTEFREHADDMLKNEVRKFTQLEHRFHTLATNHEEMIKFKDEYKRVNQELREENARLKNDNARLFSKAVQEKDARILELEKKFATIKQENSNIEAKFRSLQQEMRGKEDTLRQQLREVTESSAAKIRDLQHQVQQTEERLKGATHKLQGQQDRRESLEQEFGSKLTSITKERDELLELAMQRGKLIQKEQSENKRLQRKVEDTEKLMLSMQEKFDRDAASVNANLQVRKLRDELAESESQYAEIQKEFNAYKKHSSNLLKQEKELNERLRHLVG